MLNTSQSTYKTQRGFNLVELLVAMVIGVFLIGGALRVYTESQAAMLISDRIARLQENARYAMQTIEEDVRAAGLWGMMNDTEFVAGRSAIGAPVVIPVATDCAANWAVNLDIAIEGSNDANPFAGSCMSGVDYQPNSDVLVVRHADETNLLPAELTNGELYVRSDQTHGALFTGTAPPAGFTPDAQINRLVSVAYFVSSESDGQPGVPSLRRVFLTSGGALPVVTEEEVISGVEDMQIQFGIDSDADGSVNSYVNSDSVVDPTQVTVARIWMRVRTGSEELDFLDDSRFQYGDTDFTASATATTDDDRFRRVLISKTIEVRNRRANTAIVAGAGP